MRAAAKNNANKKQQKRKAQPKVANSKSTTEVNAAAPAATKANKTKPVAANNGKTVAAKHVARDESSTSTTSTLVPSTFHSVVDPIIASCKAARKALEGTKKPAAVKKTREDAKKPAAGQKTREAAKKPAATQKTSVASLATQHKPNVKVGAKPSAVQPVAKRLAIKKPPNPTPKRIKNILRGKGMNKKKVWQRFVIDCTIVAEDMILDVADLEKYFKTHLKVNKKVNNLGDSVNFERLQHKLVINSCLHYSKRYFKYLCKRYLKKHSLRDWVRVVSTSKYEFAMTYFKIQGHDDNEDAFDLNA